MVVGIDVALVNTGIAVIEDAKAVRWLTIKVEGDEEDTGPRFTKLRESLEVVAVRLLKRKAPSVVVIEKPEHGIRQGRDVASILKLYGSFAVCFAECARLWPRAHLVGVEPMRWKGNYPKGLIEGIMRAKYRVECANDHEWDALGLADMAWDVALARERVEARKS